jgi:hypothetical protein
VAPEIERILRLQEALPAEEVAVLQALRVVSAVELAFFTEKGRYATPAELQEQGYLDPMWPRIPDDAYSVSCEVGAAESGYYCYADPAPPRTVFYSVNPAQTIQSEIGRRPDDSSPAFGSSRDSSPAFGSSREAP